MKRAIEIRLIVALLLLVVPPFVLSTSTVSGQTGYTIDQVDHKIQIMYSGHVVVLDTVYISGQITDGFRIGLPYQYSAYVLKGFAYDDTHQYELNLGIQLGNQSGFYGAEVNFNGNSPNRFTVAFVLSNSLITDQEDGTSKLNFPAYPSLTRDVGICNVSLVFPSAPSELSITKEDGNVEGGSYIKTNLPAFAYSVASANFKAPTGTLQLTTITSLMRQIAIDATGKVTSSDTYQIINNASSLLSSFVLSLPLEAQNVAMTDGVGKPLGFLTSTASGGKMRLANITLPTFLSSGQSTIFTARYELPSAPLEDGKYVLSNFRIFPDFSYYVNRATAIFNPPEGATIVAPQANELSQSSTLTREAYQDTLTVTLNGLSFVDYLTPEPNTIQLAYNYNPIWVSFRPTFWGAFIALIGCVVAVVYRKRRPKEETYADRADQLPKQKETAVATPQQEKVYEAKTGKHVSTDDIREFLDEYEDKKQLTNELKSMELKAQKGKIPRRQYKVQKQAIEVRLEGIRRNIERTKTKFRGSSGTYEDIAKQLDLAEEDQNEAEESIRALEIRQSRGDISLETYKRNIGEHQKRRDKAEAAINGILLRLREKIR